ncbi:unnamed protein product [Strongylus vulgaris]|uniref:peptidylprolyl isomerase n=1 Tax=Strongylus vulgaris TaxID=40348 RepID=A0A3P7LFI5_STRVU|nr:unnamed protein product [Strongylus vulgaris]
MFNSWMILLLILVAGAVAASDRTWTTDEGVKIEIIKKIPGDHEICRSVIFYQNLHLDSNYTFVLGRGEVIRGMDIAMEGMCVGEQRKVTIPPEEGFDDTSNMDGVDGAEPLNYFVELKSLFRPNPGDKWITDEGVHISQEKLFSVQVTHEIDESECIKAEKGDTLHQHYTLHLEDGTFIDSSWNRNKPFVFKLHTGQVIPGMDIAMDGMCEGERRKVIIPSELAYGEKGRPPGIPGNAPLHFEIVLEKIVKAEKEEL